MKKLLSLFLTLCMLLSVVSMMAVTVGADGETADATALTPDTAWYDNHKEATDLYIGTAAELLGFSKLISTQLRANGDNSDLDTVDASMKIFIGKTIHITADIDLNPSWTAGATAPTNVWLADCYRGFTGMIDGGGHTVSGIYLSTTVNHTGIFGNARGGTEAAPVGIKNLTVSNSYITSSANILGGLFGAIPWSENEKGRYVLIENVNMEVTVKGGTTQVGGMFGYIAPGNHVTVRNCVLRNRVIDCTGASVGGIVGNYTGGTMEVSNVLMESELSTTKENNGGMFGDVTGGTVTVTNSYLNNTHTWGATSDTLRGGGVVGYVAGGTLTVSKTVVASTMQTLNANTRVRPTGGFVGESKGGTTVTIDNSLFCGINNALNNWNGGFIGRSYGTTKIDKCISAGILTPAIWTTDFNGSGAIIGRAEVATTEISNCLYTDIYKSMNSKTGPYVLGESLIGAQSNANVVKTNNHHVTPAQITGLAAAEKLTAAGMTDWTVTTTGLPLPRSIVTTFGATILAKADEAETAVTKLAGYQVSDTTDNKFNLRLVATLKLPDDNKTVTDGKVSNYTAVGFRVVANYGTETKETKVRDFESEVIYTAVSAFNKAGTEIRRYTAEELGGDYLFVLPCRNVPANAGTITMEVTTYYKTADGTVVLGATQVLTVDPAVAELK